MEKKSTTKNQKETPGSTKESIENGKKAAAADAVASGKKKETAQKDDEKDAENWRNEG